MSSTQIERLVRKRDGSLRSEQRGAGIGWRLASAIVEAHDGSITPVSDGPNHGSMIRVSLPLVTLNQPELPNG
jgi:signal transduction histidine kinase